MEASSWTVLEHPNNEYICFSAQSEAIPLMDHTVHNVTLSMYLCEFDGHIWVIIAQKKDIYIMCVQESISILTYIAIDNTYMDILQQAFHR